MKRQTVFRIWVTIIALIWVAFFAHLPFKNHMMFVTKLEAQRFCGKSVIMYTSDFSLISGKALFSCKDYKKMKTETYIINIYSKGIAKIGEY